MQSYAHRTSSRKPRSSEPSTRKRNESKVPHPKHYTALFKSRSRNDDDGYTTSSEEEIISALDESALSKLPLHLQDSMRELHAERARRLQSERRQRKPRYLYRHRDRVTGRHEFKQEVKSKPQSEKECNAYYAEKWFQKMLSKVAATRELEVQKVMEGYDEKATYGHHENMTWCPVRHEWVPVYYGQGQGFGRGELQTDRNPTDGSRVRSRAASGASRLCGIGIGERQETPLSQAETVITERYYLGRWHDCRTSSHSRYMSWRCAGPYYVYEARASEDCCQHVKRKGGLLSLISAVHNRMCTKIQWAKKIFKK
ncbi:hypothetical protein BDV18DRAFT_130109 [Aspergillus unguis]